MALTFTMAVSVRCILGQVQVNQIDNGYHYKIVLHSDRYRYFWEVEKPSRERHIQHTVPAKLVQTRENAQHCAFLWQHVDRFSQVGVCLRQQQAPRATKVHAIPSQASYMNPYIIVKSYLVPTVSFFIVSAHLSVYRYCTITFCFFVRCCSWLSVPQKHTNLPSK